MKPSECMQKAETARKQMQGYNQIIDNLLIYLLEDKSAFCKSYSNQHLMIYWHGSRCAQIPFYEIDLLLASNKQAALEYLTSKEIKLKKGF